MGKLIAAVSFIAMMGIAIALIDARSTDVGATRQRTDSRPTAPGTIYAAGTVEGATEDIELRSEIAGRVQEVLVAAGQWVEGSEVLVRLDGNRQRHEVALAAAKWDLARAELERLHNGARAEEREEARALQRVAQARLVQAERTWERVKQLSSERAISQQSADDQLAQADASRAELEAAEARVRQLEAPARTDELRAAEARVAAARAQFDLANIGLSKTELRAPRRGCVLDVDIEPGELTGADAPQPLVVLSDTSTIRVRAFVEELDAPRVAIGMPAQITADGLPDTTFTGRVVSISHWMADKSIDAGRSNELYDMKVREAVVELDDASQLIVGLRVDVTFTVESNIIEAASRPSITLCREPTEYFQ